jgi:hypothetical protein
MRHNAIVAMANGELRRDGDEYAHRQLLFLSVASAPRCGNFAFVKLLMSR